MEPDITALLEKYSNGEATPAEQKIVEEYYHSFAHTPTFISTLTEADKRNLESRLLRTIYQKINQPDVAQRYRFGARSVYVKVAASVVALLVLAISYRIYFYQKTITLVTQAGQVATFRLPDSSTVTLNGNSILTYTQWSAHENRAVTLRGEAFFSVRPAQNHQKFFVNVPGQLQVEVTGTEFNVTGRKNDARVVLSSGQVKLHLPTVAQTIIMRPGEMVELNPTSATVTKAKVNPARYISWPGSQLILERTSLRELVKILENTYGLAVTVPDATLLSHTFSGKMPKQNVDLLLLGLMKAFDLQIIKKDNRVTIKKLAY